MALTPSQPKNDIDPQQALWYIITACEQVNVLISKHLKTSDYKKFHDNIHQISDRLLKRLRLLVQLADNLPTDKADAQLVQYLKETDIYISHITRYLETKPRVGVRYLDQARLQHKLVKDLARYMTVIQNRAKPLTDPTYFVENSSYRLTREETDLFQDIIKITNFPWRKALELLKDSVHYLGPHNVKFPDRELFPHEYFRYGRDSLIDYTNILVRLKNTALEIVKTAILDGERTATGGHENFFLKDEEIIFMTIVLCREIKTLLEDPRLESIDNGTFTPVFNVKEFADDSEERLEAIYDLAQQIYKAMQRRLQRATEVISERRKKPVNRTLESASNVNGELIQLVRSRDFDKLYRAMNRNDNVGKKLQRIYEIIASEKGLHPDDDYEQIIDIMFDHLEKNYSNLS